MMHRDPTAAVILLVDTDPATLATLREPLERVGYLCATTPSFAEARTLLTELSPDLLIAAIRLGAFNGLQLALQRHLNDQPSIVTDIVDDPALRREAARFDTPYVLSTVHPEELLQIVEDTQTRRGGDDRRRWRRGGLHRRVTATVEGAPAQVVDASYGGCQLAMVGTDATGLPNDVSLSISDSSLIVRSRLVWRAPSDEQTLGLALSERTVHAVAAWRRWVNHASA